MQKNLHEVKTKLYFNRTATTEDRPRLSLSFKSPGLKNSFFFFQIEYWYCKSLIISFTTSSKDGEGGEIGSEEKEWQMYQQNIWNKWTNKISETWGHVYPMLIPVGYVSDLIILHCFCCGCYMHSLKMIMIVICVRIFKEAPTQVYWFVWAFATEWFAQIMADLLWNWSAVFQ